MKIVLASASPRREELLKKIVEDFDIIPSDIDESLIKEKVAEQLVEELSYAKAEKVFIKEQEKYDDLIVIGVDTMVALEDNLLGKPKDAEDAKKMLSSLSGKSNDVYTGLSIIVKQKNKITKEVTNSKTRVKMKEMSQEDIEEYVSSGEPLDKAGAYAVQGKGAKYIEEIEGNYDSVVGLNTDLVKEFLEKYGIEVL
ncbi:MAG: septum formation inhibitor Maf [Clostridia bacterium]|nr:septum formation inhibitor Maf [Clostridia bacterium]